MMAVIALDIGDKRVGVAIADLVTKIPRPLTTLPRNRKLIDALRKLQRQYSFNQIVVGLPITMSGYQGIQAHKTMELSAKIKQHLSVDIVFEDERLSSNTARIHLKNIPHSRADVDAVSASIILGSWLARQRKS